MNYKKEKFNLTKALHGSDVVTRIDIPVKIIGYNGNAVNGMGVAGWVEDELFTWTESGRFTKDGESIFDLFILEPNENIGFANVHEDDRGRWLDERIYDYHAAAVEHGELSPTYKGTIEIVCP